ncbi:MAG: purine operon repressor [Clostridia bacterium]|jgi:purine operon repressor|nr:pur operon repressor [Clostridiales bacterium]MDK2985228.1 purine operon repressor [Clostridia bacterium]
MEKFRRSERLAIMGKLLAESPGKLFPLRYFEDLFGTAKSTISEDITLMKQSFERLNQGTLVTVAGAAGGVKFCPYCSKNFIESTLKEMALKLSDPSRILPGSYLYLSDIIFNPYIAGQIGQIFATIFKDKEPDYIVTIETKGIPLALMTARAFNVPLVIIRDENRVTEGSSVNINYISGSRGEIETMSLARRALPNDSSVIIIDDFMKGGGTTRGMLDMMQEFNAKVLGIGIFIATALPEQKLVEDYRHLLELKDVDQKSKKISIEPVLNWLN